MAVSWLDVKLGLRMLVRYPGLSIAGGLGIAMVVVCGTVAGLFDSVINGTLPFEDGERIVAIENWDASQNRPAPHDVEVWRAQLTTVRDIGAYRLVNRNIAAPSLAPEPERIAEISAAAFTIARVAPLLGRYLVADDEQPAAPQVIVIGFEEWQRRFSADLQIVGRTIQVADHPATIVGVMPRGFGFPVNERYWMPLKLAPVAYSERRAPSSMPYKTMPHGVVHTFGRLAEGATLAAAQAELAVIGQRAAVEAAATHAHIRPRVLPYTRWFFEEQHDGEIVLVWGLVALLLAIVGANVAVLVYARTATRRIEIALRTALGASRRRIVGQMFVEGLLLSGTASGLGLFVAAAARRRLDTLVTWEQMPFWVNTSVTSGTVLVYVVTLAILGAVIIGAVPAWQATARRAQAGLQQAASGSSRWKIGRTYGALIVVQVALAVAILPYALSTAWTSIRDASVDPGVAVHEFVTAHVDVEADDAARAGVSRAELLRRLSGDSAISAAVYLAGAPGSDPQIDVDIDGQPSRSVVVAQVPGEYFRAFDIPLLGGRGLDARDAAPSSRQIVVNRSFAEQIVGGNAVGHHVRESGAAGSQPGPWLEIVGVVEDFPAAATKSTASSARIYRGVGSDDPRLGLLAVRARAGEPAALANRVREIASKVDPTLLLRDVRTLDALLAEQQIGVRIGAWASGLATLSLLLLSGTGLYALMAFSVTQRRREIGIRVALGAHPRAVVRGILSRALWQLGIGIGIGVTLAALLDNGTASEFTGGAGLRILPAVAMLVLLIGCAAAAGPARRGLRIEPSEALRAE